MLKLSNYKNKILSVVVILLSIITILLILSLLKLSIYADISVEPIHKTSNPDLSSWDAWPTNQQWDAKGVYLISYADGKSVFFKNQNTLAHSALNKGIDFIFNYRRSHLSQEFYNKNKEILDDRHGAGMWLWKPWIILDAMQKAPKDAIIIYLDTGFIIYQPVTKFVELAKKHDIVLYKVPKKGGGKVVNQVKRAALVKMGCDTKECRNAPALMSGFIVVKNNEKAKKYIEQWLYYCENKDILSRDSVGLKEYAEFIKHQDDEAVLSLLHYSNPIAHIMDYEEVMDYAWLHHRHPAYDTPYESLLYAVHGKDNSFMQKALRKIENKLLNCMPLVYLRRYLLKMYYSSDEYVT